MTTQEAKLILQAYRPDRDAAEPFFTEALECARIDSVLKTWFEEQQAFDARMQGALLSEMPPADLRAAILAAKISPSGGTKQGPSGIRYFWLLGLAAALVVFLGAAFFMQHQEGATMTVASFTQQVLDIKEAGKISLGKSGHDPEMLRSWLAQQGAPDKFVLPPGLHGMPTHGCQTYSIGATKVTMICFAIDDGQVAYLFVVDKSALKDAAPKSHPDFHEVNGLAFATWTSGDKSYVLTGDNLSKETLQKLI